MSPGTSLPRTERLGTLDVLAQYVIVARLAALALTIPVVGSHVLDVSMTFAFLVLLGVNYVVLRGWRRVVQWRLADKPHYLLLDCTLSAVMLVIVGAGAPLVLYLVGTVILAGLVYPRRPTVLAQLYVFGVFEFVSWAGLGRLPGSRDVHALITLPALLLGGGLAGAAVRRLVAHNEAAMRQIGDLHLQAAAREERLRLARDLHDSVTNNLQGIALVARSLDAAASRGDLAQARASAHVVSATATQLAAQARDVIVRLRVDDDSRPFEAAVLDVVRNVTAGQDLDVQVRFGAVPPPRAPCRAEVLAIVSEAVRNAVKHAQAAKIEVRGATSGDDLLVTVVDDGRGFDGDTKDGHFGLVGMRERAQRAGGALTITTSPGHGTRVDLRLPRVRAEAGQGRRPDGAERSGGLIERAAS